MTPTTFWLANISRYLNWASERGFRGRGLNTISKFQRYNSIFTPCFNTCTRIRARLKVNERFLKYQWRLSNTTKLILKSGARRRILTVLPCNRLDCLAFFKFESKKVERNRRSWWREQIYYTFTRAEHMCCGCEHVCTCVPSLNPSKNTLVFIMWECSGTEVSKYQICYRYLAYNCNTIFSWKHNQISIM